MEEVCKCFRKESLAPERSKHTSGSLDEDGLFSITTKKALSKQTDEEHSNSGEVGTKEMQDGDGSGETKSYTNISQIALIWLKLRAQNCTYF